jgi:UDP-glucose 4-epimerase
MAKQRCVIIGGGGFIGKLLATALHKEGYLTVVGARSKKTLEKDLPGIEIREIDIEQPASYRSLIQEKDILFDLAAPSEPYSSMLHPNAEVKEHILPHMRLIEHCCKAKVKKYIFFSSGGGVYGEKPAIPVSEKAVLAPVSPYTISKATIEYFLAYCGRVTKTKYLIYRLSNPYGPGQKKKPGFGIIPTLFDHIKNNTAPTLYSHGNLMRDFIYIDDAIDAILLSFNTKTQSSLYNLGSGHGTKIKDVWRTMRKLTKTSMKAHYEEKRPIDVDAIILDISRFKKEFNWKPKTSIEDGLRQFCKM